MPIFMNTNVWHFGTGTADKNWRYTRDLSRVRNNVTFCDSRATVAVIIATAATADGPPTHSCWPSTVDAAVRYEIFLESTMTNEPIFFVPAAVRSPSLRFRGARGVAVTTCYTRGNKKKRTRKNSRLPPSTLSSPAGIITWRIGTDLTMVSEIFGLPICVFVLPAAYQWLETSAGPRPKSSAAGVGGIRPFGEIGSGRGRLIVEGTAVAKDSARYKTSSTYCRDFTGAFLFRGVSATDAWVNI